ncbi:unnamed protein product [Urochloa humidicola]
MAFLCILPSQQQAAATAITISSDSSGGSVVVDISSSDDDEATSRPTTSRRRSAAAPPPRPAAVDEAPRRRRRAAAAARRPRRPASTTTTEQEQKKKKKKRKYTKWSLEDDRELLMALAELREKCSGVLPPSSAVRIRLRLRAEQGAFSRPDVPVEEISDKTKRLKKQFRALHLALEAGIIYSPRSKFSSDGELYRIAKKVWPKLFT